MTSLEAVETYTAFHAETFEEILEWPYRRFMKAFSAWQRRNSLDEIERRKNLHVSALYSNTNWDDEKNDREAQVENLEKYYETLKDWVWEPDKVDRENKEMQELEDSDPFLRAGKRNRQKIVPVSYPGQEDIEDIINE